MVKLTLSITVKYILTFCALLCNRAKKLDRLLEIRTTLFWNEALKMIKILHLYWFKKYLQMKCKKLFSNSWEWFWNKLSLKRMDGSKSVPPSKWNPTQVEWTTHSLTHIMHKRKSNQLNSQWAKVFCNNHQFRI